MRTKSLLLSLLASLWLLSAATAWAKEGGAFLGIVPAEVTSDIAASYGVQTGQGVLIEETVDDSPAGEAGLRSNDILLSIDGQSLTGPGELRVQLAKHKKGDTVALAYMRGGKQLTVNVELAAADAPEMDFSWTPGPDWEKKMEELGPKIERKFMKFHDKSDNDAAFAGVVTQSLSEGLRSYFKVEGGALISEVVKDSPAEKAGLKAGDVIVRIGKEEIEDEGDVFDIIGDSEPDQTIDFVVIRDGKEVTIPVTLTNRKDFYGDAPQSDEDVKAFAFELKDGELRQLDLEMKQLQEELRALGVEVDALPEIEIDARVAPVPVAPGVSFLPSEVRAISNDAKTSTDWWNWTWDDVKAEFRKGMDQLKVEFQQLKEEIQLFKEEWRARMA